MDVQAFGDALGPVGLAVGAAALGGLAEGGEFFFVFGAVDAVEPVGGSWYGPVGEFWLRAIVIVGVVFALPEGSVAPALGGFDESGAEGVSLDVAADGEEVGVLLDGEAFETALVEVAASAGVAVGVPALGVGHGEPLHEAGELSILGGEEDEVEVVGHEAVGATPLIFLL